jgi:hypothetical protein
VIFASTFASFLNGPELGKNPQRGTPLAINEARAASKEAHFSLRGN